MLDLLNFIYLGFLDQSLKAFSALPIHKTKYIKIFISFASVLLEKIN